MDISVIKDRALLAAESMYAKKGRDVVVLRIEGKASFADYLVIATGNTERQAEALMDACEDALAKENVIVKNIEGRNGSGWILMDYGDFIVNIFTGDQREKYDLEKIWGDCEYVPLNLPETE